MESRRKRRVPHSKHSLRKPAAIAKKLLPAR